MSAIGALFIRLALAPNTGGIVGVADTLRDGRLWGFGAISGSMARRALQHPKLFLGKLAHVAHMARKLKLIMVQRRIEKPRLGSFHQAQSVVDEAGITHLLAPLYRGDGRAFASIWPLPIQHQAKDPDHDSQDCDEDFQESDVMSDGRRRLNHLHLHPSAQRTLRLHQPRLEDRRWLA